MAFRQLQASSAAPDSPEKLFLDLPRRKISGLFSYQEELMRNYASDAQDLPDVALQLPTGSGKTLVGLLIGEWRRRKFKERVIYLAPTKQLVNQVVEQAKEKYGLTVGCFTGPNRDYDPADRASYKSGSQIAITTYSSLFNSAPFFSDADVIILDDIHVAENYISKLWSLRVERIKPEHASIHTALCTILKPLIEPFNYARLIGEVESITDKTWVDKLPTPEYSNIINQLIEIIDVYAEDAELAYSWQMIRDHLHACHLYFSSQEILIRPLIPPTWSHSAFTSPKHRIYMSATLGEGGDLERLVGRANIKRLPVSEGWDGHGVGRRFFIFPEMSMSTDEAKDLRIELMKQTSRSVVLVPNTTLCDEITNNIHSKLGYKVFGAEDIESTKALFTNEEPAVAVVANRYDGIDFPGDECRLLFIEGLPKATNLQERFLMSRMGARSLFNERIQTRVLQAIGRCTRSLEDYSAVVVMGEELPDYLADSRHHKYFHPELQAELAFGVEQSKKIDTLGIIENLKIFLENGQEWEKVSQQIVTLRKGMTKVEFPALGELSATVSEEINYQKKMWQGDYEAALLNADQVLALLKSPELRGYRALWHYLAGSAAWLAADAGGVKTLEDRARNEFSRAKEAASGITWLVPLARYIGESIDDEEANDTIIQEQVDRIESVFADLGTSYDRQYSAREKEIIEGLSSNDTARFERAHKFLGEMLGFQSDNKETPGAPDPWWITARLCLVFEDHSGANRDAAVSIDKARQVASHPDWMRANVSAASDASILPVLITPAKTVDKAAVAYLGEVSLWGLDDFQKWSKDALSVIRELRTKFVEPGDLLWRSVAVAKLKQSEFDAVSLVGRLKKQKSVDMLKPI